MPESCENFHPAVLSRPDRAAYLFFKWSEAVKGVKAVSLSPNILDPEGNNISGLIDDIDSILLTTLKAHGALRAKFDVLARNNFRFLLKRRAKVMHRLSSSCGGTFMISIKIGLMEEEASFKDNTRGICSRWDEI